jgi:hypothetical protein
VGDEATLMSVIQPTARLPPAPGQVDQGTRVGDAATEMLGVWDGSRVVLWADAEFVGPLMDRATATLCGSLSDAAGGFRVLWAFEGEELTAQTTTVPLHLEADGPTPRIGRLKAVTQMTTRSAEAAAKRRPSCRSPCPCCCTSAHKQLTSTKLHPASIAISQQ